MIMILIIIGMAMLVMIEGNDDDGNVDDNDAMYHEGAQAELDQLAVPQCFLTSTLAAVLAALRF